MCEFYKTTHMKRGPKLKKIEIDLASLKWPFEKLQKDKPLPDHNATSSGKELGHSVKYTLLVDYFGRQHTISNVHMDSKDKILAQQTTSPLLVLGQTVWTSTASSKETTLKVTQRKSAALHFRQSSLLQRQNRKTWHGGFMKYLHYQHRVFSYL